MPACRACGATSPPDSKFCVTCGTYFEPPAASQAAPSPAPQAGFPGQAAPPPPPGVPPVVPRARPLGVTIVSLWCLVFGPLLALVGLVLIVAGPVAVQDPRIQSQLGPALDEIGGPGVLATMLQGFGAALLVLGPSTFLVGYGMYRARPWGWTGAVALSVMWMMLGLASLLGGGVVPIVLSVALLYYLTRPGVKAWFGKAPPAEPGLPSYVPPPPPAPPSPPTM